MRGEAYNPLDVNKYQQKMKGSLKIKTNRSIDKNFHLLFALLSAWPMIGLYIDGWAHNHVLELETFFSQWHGVFYSGAFILTIFLFISTVKVRKPRQPLLELFPKGYKSSFIGTLIFFLAGLLDMFWHERFGFEIDFEALLSPPHIVLAFGGFLTLSGPLKNKWELKELPSDWFVQLPVILSIAWVLSILTFMLHLIHPLVFPWAGSLFVTNPIRISQALFVSGILIHSGLLMLVMVTIINKWQMNPGCWTIVLTIDALGVSGIQDTYHLVIVGFIGGVIADLLLLILRRSSEEISFRIFSFLLPILYYSVYFIYLNIVDEIWLSAHLMGGLILIPGILGLTFGFLVRSPQSIE